MCKFKSVIDSRSEMSSRVGAALVAGGLSYIYPSRSAESKSLQSIAPSPIRCIDGTTVIPYLAPQRSVQLKKLRSESFDVLVIGGGCVGSGIALDAAMRGMKTAMVESEDFGAGTSGRSTKLIHGGIRYLETAFKNFDLESLYLVKEALEERAYMLKAAPYMNKPLPIMIPIYKWWELPYMWAGAKMYDLVAWGRRYVPPSHYMNKSEALYHFPMLRQEGLKGAIIYYDGQMNDTRLSLIIALTATQAGATVANRVRAIKLMKDPKTGRLIGARLKDELTGSEWDVNAKVVVNATGCFADSVRVMDDPTSTPLVTPAAGVHIMLPDHFSPSKMGLIVPKTADNRVLFFLPWEGATIAGTTDSETSLTMLPKPSRSEVDFIIQESNRFLTVGLRREDVIAAWSGIRPLVRDPSKMIDGTKALSRSHVVEISPNGLVTVTGGKWTTYRKMAEDTINKVFENFSEIYSQGFLRQRSSTAYASLIGADRAGIVCAQKFDNICVTLRSTYGFSNEIAGHLVSNYGTRALQVAEIAVKRKGLVDAAGNPSRLSARYPFLDAEVIFAVEQEYAVKAIDVLARRTRLAFVDAEAARKAVPHVVKLMAPLLNWNTSRQRKEIKECEQFIETMLPCPRD